MLIKIIGRLICAPSLLTVVLLLVLQMPACTQGFDWQWTARAPMPNPKNYIGIDLGYGLQYLQGTITFLEEQVSCPSFENGYGNNFIVGLDFERWEKYNRFCYRAGAQFEYVTMNSSYIDYVPININTTGEYETVLTMNLSKINLYAGIKYRVFNTHINIGANLLVSVVVGSNFSATESILGPSNMPPFQTIPPSYSRAVAAGKINNVNLFRIQPLLSLGYDIQLARGTYIEPNVSATIPLSTMLVGDKIHNYNVLFGVKLLTSIW